LILATHRRCPGRWSEGVWSSLKRSLANLTRPGLDQLLALIKTRRERMQCRPGPLPLTFQTYDRLQEVWWDDRYGVCDRFGVPVLPLERRPAGGPGGPLTVVRLGEDVRDE
jgi:hypothetical protein